MLQTIIYTLFVINIISSFCDGNPGTLRLDSRRPPYALIPMIFHGWTDCTDAISSGVYRLSNRPYKVYCDTETHGGGWTVILRRMDGSVNFFRNWQEYKNGFGNLSGEFFLGLDKIHALTSEKSQELLVTLEDFNGHQTYEKYDEFAIGGENRKYILHTLGDASGTAGDALSYHHEMMFSTHDNNNDKTAWGNCARDYSAAWWYDECFRSNLMGCYNCPVILGFVWKDSHGKMDPLKKAAMMIRPKT